MGRRRQSILEKLINNRHIDDKTGCWNWTGYTLNGYGRTSLFLHGKWKTCSVHRLSAVNFLSFDNDSKLFVMHRCDNRKCFNPDHLMIGDNFDNMKDASLKGRLNPFGSVARNKGKTHCPKGHEYSPENTYIYEGQRHCKQCHYIASRKWRLNQNKRLIFFPTS